ncbi:MAG: hypothetical protein GF311_08235 [Candidatus Lokiarchaeota archaeon]|nr:hypothetical protein [Candidatus Lokiarchaeota archaeon]
MVDFNEKAWLVALIGGILALVAIITPFSWGIFPEGFIGWWMLGFVITTTDGFEIGFTSNIEIIIGGVIFTIILLVFGILIIIASIRARSSFKKSNVYIWIISGIILLFFTTVVITVILVLADYFIVGYMIGPALIIPYIGAILALLPGIIQLRK